MRIVICDDDALIIEQLKKYLQEFFERIHLKCPPIATFSNGEALLQDSSEKDIVFLDIEMPGLSGIYVGNELKKANNNVIIFIVTSYMEYLDEAMRFHVFRYLSKPLEKQRFFRNMKDALQVYDTTTFKIPVVTKDGVYSVSTSDIVCVEAISRKVIVHSLRGDYESTQNIRDWVQILPSNCFFQSHRSFIVNLEHVTDFDYNLIHLCNHQFDAYLTRRKYTEFKNVYLLYLESTR